MYERLFDAEESKVEYLERLLKDDNWTIMSKKDLHITFGFSGKTLLTESQLIDSHLGDISGFTDSLGLGPLCDLDDMGAIDKRKSWWQNVLGSIQSEGANNFIDDNLLLLEKITSSYDRYRNIYLWLGDDANERITTARFLYSLKELSVSIYKLNFRNMDFRNEKGVKLNLTSLQVMRAENILKAAKHFEKLSEDDVQYYVSLWENIRAKESVIHLFSKSGSYLSGDETFFDQYLLNRCSDVPQRSSYVVGYTLCEIWDEFCDTSVGDIFLFYRLKELANLGKIEISNPHEDAERAAMVFDVRKVTEDYPEFITDSK